ncbi:hypothetical protein [Geodermatophilus sp. DSM 45219]|uniref:hypothetical protein n=1 Tax=Geodermatophilus sp. DSM 45219 TaxID=1881103 RepID=UPI0008806C8C|nr:hypothetical protein [Geodermatophilus sp. DSM 45219]SDN45138.1 hypothetical protein SAMN05428965_0449 [Geodermatophilus sp. DSM 45219]
MTTVATARPAVRTRLGSLGPVPLLAALVAVDLALVGASVVRLVTAGPSPTDPWLLESDGGWAEYAGYAQQAGLAVLLLVLCRATRHAVWAAYAAVFLCALADDSLRLHESKGAWLAGQLAEDLWFPADGFLGLRANDLGELLVWGLLAAVPVAAALLLHLRSDRWNRRASLGMAGLIAAYVFFGAVLDQAHVLFLGGWFGDVLGTLEDGGELLVLSTTVVYVVGRLVAVRRTGAPEGDGAAEPAGRRAVSAPSPAA